MNPTALTTDSRIVTEIQNRLGQRLSEVPPVIEVDSVGQATQRSILVTERTVRHGVEIPVTTTGVF